ncbi:hypothetical protein Tco_0563913 [Tanacetum coccineum]
MSTQQTFMLFGFRKRPPYAIKTTCLWSSVSSLAKSKPNENLIYNSIMHGQFVKRMIPGPGDPDHEVLVAKTFHEQTNDELTEKEVEQMEADDQAIQAILMGLPEDIYVDVDSYEIALEIWLHVQKMMKGYDIGIQEKKGQVIAQAGKLRIMLFPKSQYQDCFDYAVLNVDVQNVGNQNGLIVVLGIDNPDVNQHGNGNVVAAQADSTGNGNNGMLTYLQNQLLIAQKEKARIQLQTEEFDLMATVGDLDKIKEVNTNCILMANLQQASTSVIISAVSVWKQCGGNNRTNPATDDGDDVTIDATPLSTKSPTIMLKNFDREDLKVLWSIVKARFKKTEPVNYMDNFLLFNLKTMFEHHVEDNNMLFYLLVEKMYPLINHTLHQMFNDVKLQVDYECEMAFKLLRLVKKQLKEGYVLE